MKRIPVLLMAVLFLIAPAVLHAEALKEAVVQSLQRAERLVGEGELDEAEIICRDILDMSENIFPAYNLLGSIYIARDEKQRAMRYFENSLEIYPRQVGLYLRLSSLSRDLGMGRQAMEWLEKGAEYFPEEHILNYHLGLFYFLEKNDPEKALEAFKRAEKSDPGDAKFKYLTGLSYVMVGKPEEALSYVTLLREEMHELLARRLEELMRKSAEPVEEAPPQERPFLSPRDEAPHPREERRSDGLSVGRPETSIKASGVMEIKRTLRPVPPSEEPEPSR